MVGEVAAFIPGPIGAAAGAVSAVAYLATGNNAKAAEMAVIAAANLVGVGVGVGAGAGAAVKVGLAAVRVGVKAGRVGGAAARAGAKVTRAIRGAGKTCRAGNSFSAGTPVLLADGTPVPIETIQPGDLLLTTDPDTGLSTANPVLDTITGTGTRHLITRDLVDDTGQASTLTVTTGHPLWAASATTLTTSATTATARTSTTPLVATQPWFTRCQATDVVGLRSPRSAEQHRH